MTGAYASLDTFLLSYRLRVKKRLFSVNPYFGVFETICVFTAYRKTSVFGGSLFAQEAHRERRECQLIIRLASAKVHRKNF